MPSRAAAIVTAATPQSWWRIDFFEHFDRSHNGGHLSTVAVLLKWQEWGPGRVRYVDLGLSHGFKAVLVVDEAGLLRYEHLFERVGRSLSLSYECPLWVNVVASRIQRSNTIFEPAALE